MYSIFLSSFSLIILALNKDRYTLNCLELQHSELFCIVVEVHSCIFRCGFREASVARQIPGHPRFYRETLSQQNQYKSGR